jgi:dTDP-glucose 4,6-dehydratase
LLFGDSRPNPGSRGIGHERWQSSGSPGDPAAARKNGRAAMKHIVIGGNGLVGRQLTSELLHRGEEVVVVDVVHSPVEMQRDVSFVMVDIADPVAVTRIPIGANDVIYNLAARRPGAPIARRRRHEHYWSTNYYGTFHILEAMLMAGASRLVQFSSDLVYGRTDGALQTETIRTTPLGEFAWSKLAAEGLVEPYRDLGMRISIFRPCGIVGPGRYGFLTRLFALIDRNLPVPMFGDGRQPCQLVAASDCAGAAIAAWEAGLPNEVYNLGSDDPLPRRDLLARVIREAGSTSRPVPMPAAPVRLLLGTLDRIGLPLREPDRFLIADMPPCLDASKAKAQLGWRPAYTDVDLALQAYREYRAGLSAPPASAIVLPAE